MDEAFMVDWIDGAVDETRACDMARAAGRADLIDRVRAMRGDRALLRADVEMPASGLRFEDVLRRLDADASMRVGGASSGEFVRSTGDGHASGWREPRAHRRAVPAWPFAMAAGVVLAAWVGVATVRSGGGSAVEGACVYARTFAEWTESPRPQEVRRPLLVDVRVVVFWLVYGRFPNVRA